MNTLSWMIYAADVVGSIKGLAVALLVASVVWAFGWGMLALVAYDVDCDIDACRLRQAKALKSLRVLVPAAIAMAIVPSTTTVYAIAASEAGERALNGPTGGKAVAALHAWLDRQIAGADGEKK